MYMHAFTKPFDMQFMYVSETISNQYAMDFSPYVVYFTKQKLVRVESDSTLFFVNIKVQYKNNYLLSQQKKSELK